MKKTLLLIILVAALWLITFTNPIHAGTVNGTDWSFTYSEPDGTTAVSTLDEYAPLVSLINSINGLQNGERIYITIYSFTGTALTHGAACRLLEAISNRLPQIPQGEIFLIMDANTEVNPQTVNKNYCGYVISTMVANNPNFRFEIRFLEPTPIPGGYGIMHKKDYLITPILPGVPGSGRSVVKIGTDNKTTGAYNNQHNSGITFKGDFPSSNPNLNSIGDILAIPMRNELSQMMGTPNNPQDGLYHLDTAKAHLDTYPNNLATFNNGECKVGVRFAPNPNSQPITNPTANNMLRYYVEALDAAQQTIVFAENIMTHPSIVAALIAACNRGVQVYAEVDPVDRSPGGASALRWQDLTNPANYAPGAFQNLHIRCTDDRFGPPYQPFSGPLNFTNIRLHNKITLIDPGLKLPSSMAIIGSANKTASALTGTGSGNSDETLAFIRCCEVERAIYDYLSKILYTCNGAETLPPLAGTCSSSCVPTAGSVAVNTTPADFTLWLPLDETSGSTATSLRGNHVATLGSGYTWGHGIVDGALSLQPTIPTSDPALTIPHSNDLQNDNAFVYDAWVYIPDDAFTVQRGIGFLTLWSKLDWPSFSGPGIVLFFTDFAPFNPLDPNMPIIGPLETYLSAAIQDQNGNAEQIKSPNIPIISGGSLPTAAGVIRGSWNFIAIRGTRLPDNKMQFHFRVNNWKSAPITSNQSFTSFANTQPVRIFTQISRGYRHPDVRIDEIEWFNQGLISDAALDTIYNALWQGKNKCDPFSPGGSIPQITLTPEELELIRDRLRPNPPRPRSTARDVFTQAQIDKMLRDQELYITRIYTQWKKRITQEIKNIERSITTNQNRIRTLQDQIARTKDQTTQQRLRQQITTAERSVRDLKIFLTDKQREFKEGQQYYLLSDLPPNKL